MGRRRLVVGVPMGDHISPEFFAGWNAVKWGGIERIPAVGMYVYQAHNYLVEEFLKRRDAERLVLVETDHKFPPNFLERISYYETDKPAVIGALYCLRKAPHQPCAFVPRADKLEVARVWNGYWKHGECEFISPRTAVEWMGWNQLQRVTAVGMGCTAIDREVLEAWPKGMPYFQAPLEKVAGSWELVTDDIWFCRQAARQGAEIWCDAGMPLPHLALQEVTIETTIRYWEDRARALGVFEGDQVDQAREQLLEGLPRR